MHLLGVFRGMHTKNIFKWRVLKYILMYFDFPAGIFLIMMQFALYFDTQNKVEYNAIDY